MHSLREKHVMLSHNSTWRDKEYVTIMMALTRLLISARVIYPTQNLLWSL